jgi:small subunit ribosomal protein S8
MSMTDPIADLLTRIRNAQRAGLEKIELPSSKLKVQLAEVLKNEGFISTVATRADGKQGILTLTLKYDEQKNPVISEIRRKSKPGLRLYVKHTDIPKVMNGLGIAVVSTSKGILVDREARKAHLGGELIATVW